MSGGLPEGTDEKICSWVEELLGGTVVKMDRQPRWRPMWIIDIEAGGVTRKVIARGERTDALLQFPLDHEMRFQRVLHEQGIEVPEVFGWSDDPRAFLMEAVPGRPGFADAPDHERDTVVDEYLQALAAIHQLPLEPFLAAGIMGPATPAESVTFGQTRYHLTYRATKARPDPLLEFVKGWLERHPLTGRTRVAPIVWDSGQFHHHGGHLAAVLDVEIGHLGDPMMDLAAWRMRDTVIPFGDFNKLYDRYGQLVGKPVDYDAIVHHHLFFTLTNQFAFHQALAQPQLGTDYMTYAQWVSETNLHALETMCEILGLDEPDPPVPVARDSAVAAVHEHLVRSLREISADDEYTRYQVRIAFRLARHLARYDEVGADLAEADLADLTELLGSRPDSWSDGEAKLEQFIWADHAAGGPNDEKLVLLLLKRAQRYKLLMGPPGSAMAAHHRMQPLY